MPYGQEEITRAENAAQGNRRVPPDVAKIIRETRVAEQWVRYDSVVIGPGANQLDDGWFDSWADFANADSIVWFTKRSSNVGRAYTNQGTERTDWAQDFYQTGIEFFAPAGFGEREREVLDAVIMPSLFVRELPNRMPFEITIADSDQVALFPGAHGPSGFGTTGVEASQAPAPLFVPGQQGDAHVSNTWKWPEPIMLPAQGRIRVSARVDQPIRGLLAQLDGCPGHKQLPPCGIQPAGTSGPAGNTPPTFLEYPNWYVIRVFFRGPRYLQIRGARSAA